MSWSLPSFLDSHNISEITEIGLVFWQMCKRTIHTKCLLMFWKLGEKLLWDCLTFNLIMWADSLGRKYGACKTSFSLYWSFHWIWTSLFIQWHINVVKAFIWKKVMMSSRLLYSHLVQVSTCKRQNFIFFPMLKQVEFITVDYYPSFAYYIEIRPILCCLCEIHFTHGGI